MSSDFSSPNVFALWQRLLQQFSLRTVWQAGRGSIAAAVAVPQPGDAPRVRQIEAIDIVESRDPESDLGDAKFRWLIEQSSQGLLIHRDGRPLYVNQAMVDIFGFDSIEALLSLETVMQLFAPDEWARVKTHQTARLAGEAAPEDYEVEGLRSDGTTIWLNKRSFVCAWDGGPAICTTLFDITEQVAARRRADLLREAMDGCSDMVVLYDRGERPIFTNDRYHEIYPDAPPKHEIVNYTQEQLLRRSLEAGLIEVPLAKSDPESWIAQRLAERRSVKEQVGETRHANGRTYLYKHKRTSEGGTIVLQSEITERKRAEVLLSSRSTVLEAVATGRPLRQTLSTLARGMEDAVPGLRAAVLLVDQTATRLMLGAAPSLPSYLCGAIDGAEVATTPWGLAVRSGVACKTTDFASDPEWTTVRAIVRDADIAACHAEPVVASNGRILGVCLLFLRETRYLRDHESQVLTSSAHVAAIALERARLDLDLEKRVAQRTQALSDQISEREDAEAKLKKSETMLLESQQIARIGTWEWDETAAQYAWASDELFRLYGKDPADGLEVLNDTERLIHPADLQHYHEYYQDTHDRPRPFVEEYRIVLDDGSVRRLEIRGTPVFDRDGDLIGFRGTTQDITEQRAAEERLRRVQKTRALGQLTGGVAHEFNNLLAVIIGNMELLREHLPDGDVPRNLVERSVQASERGARLTSRLLSFTRDNPLQPEQAEIETLVGGMRELLEKALGEAYCFTWRHGARERHVVVDRAKFEEALLALAINAGEAMPDGGALSVATRVVSHDGHCNDGEIAVAAGDYVALSFADEGCGIAEEDLERVFDPFFTSKGMATHSGLGLSMVQGFVEQSGGFVELKSRLGMGTMVTLCFPLSEATVESVETRDDVGKGVKGGELILFVEDDPEVRNVVTAQLGGLGYRVVVAEDGREALALLQENPDCDLLFTDIVLPGGSSGWDVAEAGRTLCPNLKVLYTTGYTDTTLPEAVHGAPKSALLHKPYRRAELARQLRAILEG